MTLAQSERFKRNYLRCMERGQALGKLTLTSLPSQKKTNKIVRWVKLLKPVSGVCVYVQYVVAGV